jgi:dTDP-4-dehydrorhamnose 3,5-epimerase-like enzyme
MPEESDAIVPVRPPFVDERGEIQNLVDAPLGSALVITSKRGAIRGNHYHNTDFHYCWLQRGRMVYAHRPAGSREEYQRWVIKPGQLFYTPPMYEHIMEFTEDSVIFAVSRNSRTMADYEQDTVRLTPGKPSGS